jgi:PEP-CTERM motif
LGLTNADVNGNFSHNIFTATGGMNTVANNPNGAILSLDFSGQIGSGGVTPEPGTLLLFGTAIVIVALFSYWDRTRKV